MGEQRPAIQEADVDRVRARVLALLRGRLDAMVRPWLEGRRTGPDARRRREDRQAVHGLLDAVLEGPDRDPRSMGDRLNGFLAYRRRQGLDLGGLFRDLGTLRQAAWTALAPELRGGSLDPLQAGLVVNEAFDQALEALVQGLHRHQVVNLKEAALADSLTGLSNHRHFYQRLQEELKRASRLRYPVSVLLIDVDFFKRFNDEHGHQAGDHALRQLAEVLSTQRRATDTCARYGGEEFAMILPGAGPRDVVAVARNLAHRFHLGSGLSFSGGIATYPADGETASGLVEAADRALYRAKAEGRDRILPA